MAPISPRWFARRSSSAMSARSQAARGGASTPSAASTARAKANEYATVLSPDVLPASLAARSMERPRHQALYALVHVSETLLQPDNRFAACRKSKMPWLDDAGMHGPDRDLMQALTLGGQEAVGSRRRGRRNGCSQRMADAPLPVIKPRPRIRQSLRLQSEQVGGRALEAQCGRMQKTDRRVAAIRAFQADDADVPGVCIEKRHVDSSLARPKDRAGSSGLRPVVRLHGSSFSAAPRRAPTGRGAQRDGRPGRSRSARARSFSSSASSQNVRDMLEPGDQRWRQIDAGGKYQHQVRIHRHVGCLGRRSAAVRFAEGDTGQPEQQGAESEQKPEYQGDRQEAAVLQMSNSRPGIRS